MASPRLFASLYKLFLFEDEGLSPQLPASVAPFYFHILLFKADLNLVVS